MSGKDTLQENSHFSINSTEVNKYYDNYFGKSIHNWRLISLGSIALAFISTCGLIWISVHPKIIPFAIELDGSGEVIRVTKAEVSNIPNDRQIMAALRNWIIGARTIYTDKKAQDKILNETYSMIFPESECYQMLTSYHQENNPFERSAKETVTVNINAIIPISPKKWQIDWTEHTKQFIENKEDYTKNYQAEITIELLPPSTEDAILLNPLGIFAKYCSWAIRFSEN